MSFNPPSHPRIKICCIQSIEEMLMAVHHGASAIGLVSEMPSGPGAITEAAIAEIASAVPPGVMSVLLTCRTETEAIAEQHRHCRTNAIQLVDTVGQDVHGALREALPGVSIIQAVHVTDDDAFLAACAVAPNIDALLLDSGRPGADVPELGGTGRVHDWNISRRIREAVDVPVYLAGGLCESNVVEANRAVRPFGLDICSGVRREGRLDEILVSTLIAKAMM